MHFGITEKLTTDCVSLYNKASFTSKVYEKWPAKTLKIAVVDKTLYRQRLESLAYILAGDCMGLSSFKFLWWASKDASFLQQRAHRPFKLIQGR